MLSNISKAIKENTTTTIIPLFFEYHSIETNICLKNCNKLKNAKMSEKGGGEGGQNINKKVWV